MVLAFFLGPFELLSIEFARLEALKKLFRLVFCPWHPRERIRGTEKAIEIDEYDDDDDNDDEKEEEEDAKSEEDGGHEENLLLLGQMNSLWTQPSIQAHGTVHLSKYRAAEDRHKPPVYFNSCT